MTEQIMSCVVLVNAIFTLIAVGAAGFAACGGAFLLWSYSERLKTLREIEVVQASKDPPIAHKEPLDDLYPPTPAFANEAEQKEWLSSLI